MKKTLILLTAIMLGMLGMNSCKKFVDIAPPKNQLVTSKVFADSLDANSAVAGIYIDMYQSFGFGFASGGLTAYPGYSSDEFSQTSNDPEVSQFFDNRIAITNTYNNTLWSSAYKFIYDANACIEGVSSSTGISKSAKAKFLAEARQIRAFLYFNLANVYGAVPLILSTDYRINRSKARTPIDSVYNQVIEDLHFAQAELPKNKVAQRSNFYSASALLAKVQLYHKDYKAAEEAANAVINSGNYQLEPDLNNVFLANSTEAIWKIIPVFTGIETWEGYNFVPSDPTAAPPFVISDGLYNSFEPGDQRKNNWIASNTVNGTNYPYPYKYKAATTTGNATENYVIFRLAEIYLIRAEAKANLNDISGALADVNAIRKRAGLTNLSSSDQQSLLIAIEKERRSELFCEWGNRWFDLKRTGRADNIFSVLKPGWSHNALLYPIPDAQMKTNAALKQNPGY